jgi:hypothetical protein
MDTTWIPNLSSERRNNDLGIVLAMTAKRKEPK